MDKSVAILNELYNFNIAFRQNKLSYIHYQVPKSKLIHDPLFFNVVNKSSDLYHIYHFDRIKSIINFIPA